MRHVTLIETAGFTCLQLTLGSSPSCVTKGCTRSFGVMGWQNYCCLLYQGYLKPLHCGESIVGCIY